METIAQTPAMSGAELREYPRIGVAFSAVVRVQGTERVAEGAVVDLSGNGLRLQLDEPQTPGTELSITMQFDGDSVLTSAEVVWSKANDGNDHHDVACRFVD